MTRNFIRLIVALALAFMVSLCLGAVPVAPARIAAAVLPFGASDPMAETILWTLRLPRALLALLVGAALGVSGVITQAIMRNPLADPGLLGINAGAALMAMLVIVEWRMLPDTALPLLSFAGALIMTVAIFALSWRDGTTSLRLILVGLGLSALAGALASFIATFGAPVSVQRAMIWMAGSLQDSRWDKFTSLALWLAGPMTLVCVLARQLDVIAFDDPVAQGLGMPVHGARLGFGLLVAGICGAAVAAAGLIAFVGLAAPHLARALFGAKHAVLLPGTALIGALLLICADMIARYAMAPVELPAGLVTGLIGAPFLAWMLMRSPHV